MADPSEGAKVNPVEDLAKRIAKADWSSDYSDDYDVRKRGSQEVGGILTDLRTLHQTDPEAVRTLWKENVPPELGRPQYLITPEERKKQEELTRAVDEWWAETFPEDFEPNAQAHQKQRSGGREP